MLDNAPPIHEAVSESTADIAQASASVTIMPSKFCAARKAQPNPLGNGAIERNHEAFANHGAIICAPDVKRLLKKNWKKHWKKKWKKN